MKTLPRSVEENTEKFYVEECVTDWAVKDKDGKIITICNSHMNADLIATILEKDSHQADWQKLIIDEKPVSIPDYTFTEDDYFSVAKRYKNSIPVRLGVYEYEKDLINGKPNRQFMPGSIVRHFKGNLYEVKQIVKHSEISELLVVYQALYASEVNYSIPETVILGERQTFVRPLFMFAEKVDRNKYPNADQEYRMEIVKFKDITKVK